MQPAFEPVYRSVECASRHVPPRVSRCWGLPLSSRNDCVPGPGIWESSPKSSIFRSENFAVVSLTPPLKKS